MKVVGILELILIAAVVIAIIAKIVARYLNQKRESLELSNPALKVLDKPQEIGKIPENDGSLIRDDKMYPKQKKVHRL